ncbi:hypothetical protein LQ567_04075 [Niabella pedocola]|uniref:Uncharacterized protein n=1 Tax=Niabella pedocola TaxID=1752077 RepID=A0ABS8PQ21_9BACT|nr:hypothetical protein [Niabella pedocola]MCD2421926.1 hypothetical protein [Niabella pedocola]
MKKRSNLRTAVWALLPVACAASLSFTPPGPASAFKPEYPFTSDTLPAITEFETGRLDAALNYVEEQIRTHDAQWDIKRDHIQQEAHNVLSAVDLAKIQAEARAAVKKINFEQLNKDIETAMAGIDKATLERDISRAMKSVKNIDAAQLKSEINTTLKNIRLDQLKGQLEATRRDLKMQQQQLEIEMRQMKPGMNNELQETRRQLQRLKDAYQEMERDGLIEKSPANRIQFRDGELYINGERQSKETSEKYRHYFNKRKTATGKIVAV